MSSALKVVIVGAGLGGLACAIACRREGLEVIVLERTAEFQGIGAGIQLPSNASRIMRQLGLYEKLEENGAVSVQGHTLRSYSSGMTIGRKLAGEGLIEQYGSEWMVIHRADYQKMLLEEAKALNAEIWTDCEVVRMNFGSDTTSVELRDGRTLSADTIIGADGLWSKMRDEILGHQSPPSETGDLAYRGTFSHSQLADIQDEEIQGLLRDDDVQVWMGPQRHVVFYPVRNKTEFNLVLIRPDDLPRDTRSELGSLDEMRASFQGWDPRLTEMIAQLKSAVKWKLCHHEELETWVRQNVALLGDSSHPTLPYQAQGAAMAVEDGAVLGVLLGRLQSCQDFLAPDVRTSNVHKVLKLYESLRKQRTTLNVQGAVKARNFYHLSDEDDRLMRDEIVRRHVSLGEWPIACRWVWGDADYQRSLLGFDVLSDANEHFETWRKTL